MRTFCSRVDGCLPTGRCPGRKPRTSSSGRKTAASTGRSWPRMRAICTCCGHRSFARAPTKRRECRRRTPSSGSASAKWPGPNSRIWPCSCRPLGWRFVTFGTPEFLTDQMYAKPNFNRSTTFPSTSRTPNSQNFASRQRRRRPTTAAAVAQMLQPMAQLLQQRQQQRSPNAESCEI
jgi:hypothetical protein